MHCVSDNDAHVLRLFSVLYINPQMMPMKYQSNENDFRSHSVLHYRSFSQLYFLKCVGEYKHKPLKK